MATDQSFVDYIIDQISLAGEISFRKMFGEYALYCDGKVVALICNNQLFVKQTEAGRALFLDKEIIEAPAYPSAKMSFLIEDYIDDGDWLTDLIRITSEALPVPKPKNKNLQD